VVVGEVCVPDVLAPPPELDVPSIFETVVVPLLVLITPVLEGPVFSVIDSVPRTFVLSESP
jgi:hypothetical protein